MQPSARGSRILSFDLIIDTCQTCWLGIAITVFVAAIVADPSPTTCCQITEYGTLVHELAAYSSWYLLIPPNCARVATTPSSPMPS